MGTASYADLAFGTLLTVLMAALRGSEKAVKSELPHRTKHRVKTPFFRAVPRPIIVFVSKRCGLGTIRSVGLLSNLERMN